MHIVRLKISRFSGARLADVALGRRAERVAGSCWGQRRIEQLAVEGIRPMSADYRVVTRLARRREVTTASFVFDGSKWFDENLETRKSRRRGEANESDGSSGGSLYDCRSHRGCMAKRSI
jgi:hypothetical protein